MEQLSKSKKSSIIQLKRSPGGYLGYGFIGEKRKIYWKVPTDGKIRRITITGDLKKQSAIACGVLAEKRIDDIDFVNDVLNDAYMKISAKCDFDYIKFCVKAFPWMNSKQIEEIVIAPSPFDDWAAAEYEQLDFRVKDRNKPTKSGLYVRSKSEQLIAEALYNHRIAFRYEEVIRISEFRKLSPDFTIKRNDGKVIYWEHEGLNVDEKYRERQKEKMELYEEKEIYPWKNLIITYDDEDGAIDMRRIEFEIINRLTV